MYRPECWESDCQQRTTKGEQEYAWALAKAVFQKTFGQQALIQPATQEWTQMNLLRLKGTCALTSGSQPFPASTTDGAQSTTVILNGWEMGEEE